MIGCLCSCNGQFSSKPYSTPHFEKNKHIPTMIELILTSVLAQGLTSLIKTPASGEETM